MLQSLCVKQKQITTLERKTVTLQREIQEKTDEIEATKRKLDQYKDYDSVKSELEILKVGVTNLDIKDTDTNGCTHLVLSILTNVFLVLIYNGQYIEFSGSRGVDADDDWDERVLTIASKNLEKPLEVLMLEKNRKLENELTELKVLHDSVKQELDDVRTRHETASRQLSSQTELIQRLEEDITRLNQSGVGGMIAGNNGIAGYMTGPLGGPTSPPTAKHPFAGEVVGGVALGPVLPSTPRTPGFPTTASLNADPFTTGGSNPVASAAPSADQSILPIVTSQRDRFRQRNSELEEQLRQQSEQISNLRNEISQLQRDNLKLYEKAKYMQSYRDESSGSGVGAGYSAPSTVVDFTTPFRNSGVVGRSGAGYKKDDGDDIHMQSLDPTDKYRSMYEETMNPFEAFHKKEESRRFNSMTPADKAMLTMSRLVLTNKWTRTMLVTYTMGLHFLMVMMLYKMSAWEECRHDHETPNDANPMLPVDI